MTGRPDSDKPSGPLAGIKVLDFCSFINGAYSAALMGDLGAEVIKVEEPSGFRLKPVILPSTTNSS